MEVAADWGGKNDVVRARCLFPGRVKFISYISGAHAIYLDA